jgi:hypothetical protein
MLRIKRIGTMLVFGGLCFTRAAGAAGGQTTVEAPTARVVMSLPTLAAPNPPPAKRPVLLPALYVTLGAVQVWDVYSTSAALKAGAHERNPLVAPVAANRSAMLGIKVAAAASTIFFAERLWRRNRTAAIVVMAAINGATAAVAMHNVRNARSAARR